MKSFLPVLCLLAASATAAPRADIRDVPVTREGSTLLLDGKPWKAVGANVYWLGLDENVTPASGEPYYAPLKASYPTKGRTTEIMAVVKAMGGTAIRAHTLGVSTGNPLSLVPAPGQVNKQAFEPIDWAVWQAREYGLRLLIPLTDNFDYYHGGKYNFLRWAGFNLTQTKDSTNPLVMQFYTNETIVGAFKDYIRTLITHVNPYTNLSYADDPTIFAYETGNELCGPVWGDMNVPARWVREIGGFVKQLAPKKLIVDGTYGVNKTHLSVEEVDIFSDHYYPVSIGKLRADVDLVNSVNKTYFAGEYTWVKSAPAATDADLASWFKVLEQSPAVIGDALWSLFGHNVPDCKTFVEHSDGLTLQYVNPAHATQIQLIRQHFMKASQELSIAANAPLPQVPCPASTSGTETGTRRNR
ncbi:glycoside hydrolase superfamily [Lasiosphaeria miniovina]|uniref:mannan endo-1,4-beta-mannosidase n=1 Tax=Lasiosphaeria miniovina TaxID=1954250 RepID=A0AA40EDZ2_9PEZI|nr:glycoside hydrolase superfamily [Lasiosphaeria miniovina]KAK0734872.1 glycoside hydrolase superfamily [Lasiosphaeria miniovina]